MDFAFLEIMDTSLADALDRRFSIVFIYDPSPSLFILI